MNATIMWPSGFQAATGVVRWTAAAATKRTRPLRTIVRNVMAASTESAREASRPDKRWRAGDRTERAPRSPTGRRHLNRPAPAATEGCGEELRNPPLIQGKGEEPAAVTLP